MPDRVTTFTCGLFKGRKRQVSKPALYTPEWVNKLYRGVARNMSAPFRFVCVTDHQNLGDFVSGIEPYPLIYPIGNWLCLNECFRSDLGIDRGVFMGLDTVICNPLDAIVNYDGAWAWMHNPVDERLHDINAFVIWDQKRVGDKLWKMYDDDPNSWPEKPAIQYGSSKWPGTNKPVMTLNVDQDAPSEMLMWSEVLKILKIQPDYLDDLHLGALQSANLMNLRGKGTEEEREVSVAYFSGSFTPASDNVPSWLQKHWI